MSLCFHTDTSLSSTLNINSVDNDINDTVSRTELDADNESNVNIVDESTDGESATETNDVSIALRNLRLKNRHGLIIAYLNINSIRNKIDFLRPMISETIDILIIAETKIDNTFSTSQFFIEGFMKPYRYDRNQNWGGLLILSGL